MKAERDIRFSVCPFCGESMRLKLWGSVTDKDWYVQCETCTTTGPYGETDEIAVAQWNNNFRGESK